MCKYKVSVIVPYYNKWTRTKYLLESLNRQTMQYSDFEVIVIDDGSLVPFEEAREGFRINFSIKVIRTENRGRSKARNEGLQHAGGEVILFIDDDMIASPALIQEHCMQHLQDNMLFVHGTIFDMTGLTLYENPEDGTKYDFLISQGKNHREPASLLSFDKVFGHWEDFIKRKRVSRLEALIQEISGDDKLKRLQWVASVGGNLSVRKENLLIYGGFDENFIVWGGEDFELGYRLAKAGLQAKVLKDSFAYHLTHAHKDLLVQRNISKTYFYKKHMDDDILILYDYLDGIKSLEDIR